jgi:integrase
MMSLCEGSRVLCRYHLSQEEIVRGHIERRRRGLYAVVEVPLGLRQQVGRKRLRKTLATSDLAVARLRLMPILDDLNAIVEAAKARAELGPNKVASDHVGERDVAKPATQCNSDQLPRSGREFRAEPSAAAPVDQWVGQWLADAICTPRTRADHWRAVRKLQHWGGATVGSVDRQKAGAFITWMHSRHSAQWTGDRRTVRKYLSSLSGYWKWMQRKGLVAANPWLEQPLARTTAPDTATEIRERAFTDAEVRQLLHGPADAVLADLMRIGALTGARLEAIISLRVQDCIGGNFRLRANRNAARARLVPIHSELVSIVKRRAEGKRLDDFLFEELGSLPRRPKADPSIERSTAIGKRFGRYLRAQKLAIQIAGRRRSLVNFESFRRWFIAKASSVGQSKEVIAAVVGHKRRGFAAYSARPSLDQLRACVEQVVLPFELPQVGELALQPIQDHQRQQRSIGTGD